MVSSSCKISYFQKVIYTTYLHSAVNHHPRASVPHKKKSQKEAVIQLEQPGRGKKVEFKEIILQAFANTFSPKCFFTNTPPQLNDRCSIPTGLHIRDGQRWDTQWPWQSRLALELKPAYNNRTRGRGPRNKEKGARALGPGNVASPSDEILTHDESVEDQK